MRDLIRSRHIQALLVSDSQFGYALLPYLRRHCPDMDAFIRHAVDLSARASRAIPTPEEAARSAIEAIQLARQAHDVARLWETGGCAGDIDLPPARRAALQIVRSARKHLRPWCRRLAARDGSRLRRSVLTVRDWVVRWVYRNSSAY